MIVMLQRDGIGRSGPGLNSTWSRQVAVDINNQAVNIDPGRLHVDHVTIAVHDIDADAIDKMQILLRRNLHADRGVIHAVAHAVAAR